VPCSARTFYSLSLSLCDGYDRGQVPWASFPLIGHSLEDLSHIDGSGNFWDIGNHKVVLKRINTGAKLCDELVKLMNER
jgi:hypothetical protein